MEEDIQNIYYNQVNKEQDVPIQEYRKYIEIIVVNEISDTESTYSNMRRSEREKHPEEILEPTMKGQIYMKSYKVKNIDKHTKKEPKKIWHETNETEHIESTFTK